MEERRAEAEGKPVERIGDVVVVDEELEGDRGRSKDEHVVRRECC